MGLDQWIFIKDPEFDYDSDEIGFMSGRDSYQTSARESNVWKLGYSKMSIVPDDIDNGKYNIGRDLLNKFAQGVYDDQCKNCDYQADDVLFCDGLFKKDAGCQKRDNQASAGDYGIENNGGNERCGDCGKVHDDKKHCCTPFSILNQLFHTGF